MTRKIVRFPQYSKVRVRGQRKIAYILRLMNDEWGGVVLDRPIDGLRLWNVDALVLVAKPGQYDMRRSSFRAGN